MRRARLAVTALAAVLLLAGCAPTPSPTPAALPVPSPSPSTTAAPTPLAPSLSPAGIPSPSPAGTPSPSPAATPTPTPTPVPPAPPTRVAIASLGIDLPVVEPPKRSTFPLCEVAEYFPPPTFDYPGADGVTYIYAHAREGMFLPILLASRRANGKSMLGQAVEVWTASDVRYTYEITRVRRFQKRLDWAFDLPPGSLVLQTSETPSRSGSKVMLVARQVGGPVAVATEEAQPTARPVRCSG